MIKVLNECLKLHLPTSFVSTTLLTCGFFEILFSDEGAKVTRKITSVEWNGMNFFFSRYVLNFDSNAHGVEVMLTHMVKVKFPNLHEQFQKKKKTLTIMANKISDVLEIELA